MVIRKLTKLDLPFLLEIRNHESTRVNLENDSVFDIEQCEKWYDNIQSPWFIIEVNNVSVGYIRVDGDFIGIDIHMDHRKKGYAKQAFKKYLKDKKYAKLWVFEDNFAKDLYLKLGFIETGNTKSIRNRLYIEMELKKNMNYINPKIESSYYENDIGKTLYEWVLENKPKKIIDFGLLYGYSTICLAQAVRDNGFGEIIGYDIFEDYQYKYSVKSIVENNLKNYNLSQYVTLEKMDFYNWIENYNEDFDLLHLDISNNGDIIERIHNKYPNSTIIFEGGSEERDKCEWMIKYNKRPINNIDIPFKVINPNFPSLSIIN